MGYIVSNVVVLVNGLSAAKRKYLSQISSLYRYSSVRRVPISFQNKISAFYKHQLKVMGGIDETAVCIDGFYWLCLITLLQLISELPYSIQQQILESTVKKYLKNVAIFRRINHTILNRLCEAAKLFNYSPEDVVVSEGSMAKGLYSVSR
jgi:hypothetical protein